MNNAICTSRVPTYAAAIVDVFAGGKEEGGRLSSASQPEAPWLHRRSCRGISVGGRRSGDAVPLPVVEVILPPREERARPAPSSRTARLAARPGAGWRSAPLRQKAGDPRASRGRRACQSSERQWGEPGRPPRSSPPGALSSAPWLRQERASERAQVSRQEPWGERAVLGRRSLA